MYIYIMIYICHTHVYGIIRRGEINCTRSYVLLLIIRMINPMHTYKYKIYKMFSYSYIIYGNINTH